MGNEKQFLIYRSCASLNYYLERYRLPKDFRAKIENLNSIAEEMYSTVITSNVAISTFAKKAILETQTKLSSLKDNLKQNLVKF